MHSIFPTVFFLSLAAGLAPRAQAQSTQGIALPSLLLRVGQGPWHGQPCSQPSGWSQTTTVQVASGATATVRFEYFDNPFLSTPFVLGISPTYGVRHSFPGFLEGPVLLDPASIVLLAVALPGPIAATGLGCNYGNRGIELTSAIPLPPGSTFGLQGVGGITTSPLLVVQVQ